MSNEQELSPDEARDDNAGWLARVLLDVEVRAATDAFVSKVREYARRDGEAALAKRVRDAGMAVLAKHEDCLDDLVHNAGLDRDADWFSDAEQQVTSYARALLAMLEAAKEPT